jgi:hypothetical protein
MIVLATAAAFIGGLTADAFARGGSGFGAGAHMGGGGRGGFVRNPTTLLGSPAPQMPEACSLALRNSLQAFRS